MAEIRYYVGDDGRVPFTEWEEELDDLVAAKVSIALRRIAEGNLSSVKGVGGGVLEFRDARVLWHDYKRTKRTIKGAV
jgi:putative component of toxin-antitoxin plasmid stabilization module